MEFEDLLNEEHFVAFVGIYEYSVKSEYSLNKLPDVISGKKIPENIDFTKYEITLSLSSGAHPKITLNEYYFNFMDDLKITILYENLSDIKNESLKNMILEKFGEIYKQTYGTFSNEDMLKILL